MTKKLIDIDEAALTKAIEILGPGTTQRDAVNTALRALIRPSAARELLDFYSSKDPAELDKLRGEAWR